MSVPRSTYEEMTHKWHGNDDSFPYVDWERLLNNQNEIIDSAAVAEIGEVILSKCLSSAVSENENLLLEAIPALGEALRTTRPENRTLKLTMEVAKSVGYNDIYFAKRTDEKRLMFEMALIVIYYLTKKYFNRPYADMSAFLSAYPELSQSWGISDGERVKLFHFANFMRCSQRLLPVVNRKRAHLMDLVTRLTEGYTVKYITGSGQTRSTSLRVLCYERECGK
jgi:hypothetical protein